MKLLLVLVCCVSLTSISAYAQKKGAGKAAAAKGAAGAPMTDQQFVDFAAQTDMMEANLGQLAGNTASAQPIKDYAQMLVTDHTADYQQLSTIAKQANLNVPNAIDEEHNKMLAPFEKLKGAAFDKKYEAEMVAGHTKAIAMYKKAASDAQSSELKSYAQQALPVLQKHLDGAKDLGKSKAAAK